jgi:hypothetical protein
LYTLTINYPKYKLRKESIYNSSKGIQILAGPQWPMPVILATQEVRAGGSWFKAAQANCSRRLYLKNPFTKKKDWWSGSR